MKRIGKVWIMLAMAMFLVSNALAIDIDNSDVPLDEECVNIWNLFTDAQDAAEIDWSPEKWSFPQAKDWSASVMGLRVGADGNIAVRFIMTQEDINFFRNAKFNGTNVRVPFALEIDVVDHNSAFGEAEVEDFTVNKGNVPDSAGLREDLMWMDDLNTLGAIIMHPAELEADTVYQIVFDPDNNLKSSGVVHVNFQLTVNYKWIAAMVNGESTKCDILDFIGDFRDSDVEFRSGGTSGWDIAVENNSDYSNVPSETIHPWYYFLAAKNDSSFKVGFQLNRENHAVCWNEHENPTHDDSSYYGDDGEFDYRIGKDWCILDDNEINLWRLEIGSKYYYNYTIIDNDSDGFSENDDCNDTNHLVYPGAYDICGDGIDQNCDGQDSVCGGGSGGDDNDDPNDPEPTEPDSDPDLHISRFHIKEPGDDDYKHKVKKTLGWDQSFRVRGELKVRNESSLEALDVDSDYRIEDNRDFDKHDTKVDEDSPFDIDPGEKVTKTMNAISVRVSDDGQSVRVSGDNSRTFPVVNNFAKFYIFADVKEEGREDGDRDVSSESDSDEYGAVEIIVQDPPITANFGATPTSGIYPLTVSFTDTSSGHIDRWNWTFGDGYIGNGQNLTHTYENPGIYVATLIISNFSHVSYKRLTVTVEGHNSPDGGNPPGRVLDFRITR